MSQEAKFDLVTIPRVDIGSTVGYCGGKVIKIEDNKVTVTVNPSQSYCDECRYENVCPASESTNVY